MSTGSRSSGSASSANSVRTCATSCATTTCTTCCTKVCPEGITITDNAIILLKERVVDQAYGPLKKFAQLVTGRGKE